jgi:uncharacterized protein YllA (UPF0747 family)
LVFTEPEILHLIDTEPEKFSPNVILRPLFQELILPNLAFVGGGAEVAYWWQQRAIFEHHNIHYPMVLRRTSAHIIDNNQTNKINKLHLNFTDFCQTLPEIETLFLLKNNFNTVNFESFNPLFNAFYESIQQNLNTTDASILTALNIEKTKSQQGVQTVLQKANKLVKQKHEAQFLQIQKIHEQIFPNDSFAERNQTWVQHFAKLGYPLFDALIKNSQVFKKQWLILEHAGKE